MNDFLNKLLKIQSDYFRRMQFLFILDLISIFSIFYAIFIIFHVEFFIEKSSISPLFPVKIITPISAFIIAIIGAFLLHRNDHKKNVILLIENKYPELGEKLRTAYDNRDEINIIVESLKNNVTSALNNVLPSQLLASSIVITKIILVIVFISGATFVSFNPEYTIPPETTAGIFNTTAQTIGNFTGITISEVVGVPPTDQRAGKTGGGEIFGRPEIAPVEGKPVDLQLELGLGIGNVPREYSAAQNQFIQSAMFPVDVLGANVSDGGYSTLIKKTEIEKKLIEDYAVERSKIQEI